MFGPRSQKLTLVTAGAVAAATTIYALVLSILCYRFSGTWYILAVWAVIVATGVPLLMHMYRRAWRLIDEVSRM